MAKKLILFHLSRIGLAKRLLIIHCLGEGYLGFWQWKNLHLSQIGLLGNSPNPHLQKNIYKYYIKHLNPPNSFAKKQTPKHFHEKSMPPSPNKVFNAPPAVNYQQALISKQMQLK